MSPALAERPAVKPPLGRQITVLVAMIVAVALVSFLGSLASTSNVDGWYQDAEKVSWNPPGSVFGPAWGVLYAANAAVGFLLWRAGYCGAGTPNTSRPALTVFGVQLGLNLMWTPTFFAGYPIIGEPAWWAGLVVITALIVAVAWLMVLARRRSLTATILLIPYLLWLLFASTLNIGIIALN